MITKKNNPSGNKGPEVHPSDGGNHKAEEEQNQLAIGPKESSVTIPRVEAI